MPPRIGSDQIDGIQLPVRHGRRGTDPAGHLNCPVLAQRVARLEQCPGNVLWDQPMFVFPAFDIGTRDVGLQVLPMMMLGVPRARGLMKAADPKHRFGNELEAHLKPLEAALDWCYVVFTEDAEVMF